MGQQRSDFQAFVVPGHYEVKGVDLGTDDHTVRLKVLIRPPQLFVLDARRIEPEDDNDSN